MSDSITLSKDRGINPRMTVCVRCGKDTESLALVGDNDYLHECKSCGQKVLGPKQKRKCPNCGAFALIRERRLGETEKIPMGYCDACKAEIEEHKKIVEGGGIYWKCSVCGSGGVIRAAADIAQAVRKQMNIEPPAACGIEFDESSCPVCNPEMVEEDSDVG